LLAAGADPDARGGGGSTPLMETDEPDVARALIAAGADLTLRNDRGATALAVARATGRAEVVAALLAAGAE
jgi:ankyrin repeat protein